MNRLNCNLLGQVVVIYAYVFQPQFQGLAYRLWQVVGGYGASPYQNGRQLQCRSFLTGEEGRFDGMAVERLATDEDLAAVQGG